jgi:hypothetical protein
MSLNSIGTTTKIVAAAATTAAVTGGLVIAHERVFLRGQPEELRRSRTLLTGVEIAAVGALGTGVGMLATRGTARTAIAASGAALVASSLAGAAWAVSTAPGSRGTEAPFSQRLADIVESSPPRAIRAGEVALGGMLIGGVVGAITRRSVLGALGHAGIGGVGGAAAGYAAFGFIDPNR